MSPRKKPSIALTKVPSVGQLCDQLGFENSSMREVSGFTNTIHAFRKNYKTRKGQSGADLTDWKSPIVQQDLRDMALMYLEAGNGDIFWSNPGQGGEYRYPLHKDSLAELLKQLFWRQNKYAFNNTTYGGKRNSEPRDRSSRDKTTPAQEVASVQQNSMLPPGFTNRPASEYNSMYRDPSRQIHEAQNSASRTVTGGDAIIGDRNSTTSNDVYPPNPTVEDIYDVSMEIPNGGQLRSIEKPKQSKPITLKLPSRELGRFDGEASTANARPRKRLRTTPTKPSKRRRNNSPGIAPRTSGRTRRVRYDSQFGIELDSDIEDFALLPDGTFSDAEENLDEPGHGPTYQSHQVDPDHAQSVASVSTLHGSVISQTTIPQRERSFAANYMDLTTSPVGQSAPEDSDLVESARNRSSKNRPTVSDLADGESMSQVRNTLISPIATSATESQPQSELPDKVPEQQTLPDRAEQSTISPDHASTSKPKIDGVFWIVTSPEPELAEEHWEDGTIQGKSLSFVVQEVSKVTRNVNIEMLKMKIKTPFAQRTCTCRVDDEEKWEFTKGAFTNKIKEAWARIGDHPFQYDVFIEPIYAVEVSSGEIAGAHKDFEFSL